MLYVYYGSDTNKVRSEALAKLAATNFSRIESGNFSVGQVTSSSKGQSLFGGLEGYLLDNPSENSEYWTEVISNLDSLSKSEHLFVMVESTILAEDKKKITKFATEIIEYKKTKTDDFNQFALTDALAARDKRQLWLLLQESLKNGSAAEEIIGILWWQLKTMRLAALTNSAAEAGMKDYPYKKAKAALLKFPLPLVVQQSRALTALYHDARSGKGDMLEQLEIWTLSL